MAKAVYTDLDFQSVSKAINLPAPTNDGDAANKSYVDALIEGLSWKDGCRVSTQSNIDLSSPGATIDSISMVTNDRVLVRGQTAASENGIYIWNGASTPMTRALDADTASKLEAAAITVEEGTDADSTFRQTSVNFTLDTDDIIWASFGTSAPAASETTAGVAELATQTETNAGTDDARIVTPLKLAAWSGKPKRYAADVGDGSNTQYDITHNLGTYDVVVEVHRNSGNRDTVICDVGRQSTNQIRLNFASAPASNAFRIVVLA